LTNGIDFVVGAKKINIDREKNLEHRCNWLVLQISEHLAQSEPGIEIVVCFVARSGCDQHLRGDG
jgi:hypothetical protein